MLKVGEVSPLDMQQGSPEKVAAQVQILQSLEFCQRRRQGPLNGVLFQVEFLELFHGRSGGRVMELATINSSVLLHPTMADIFNFQGANVLLAAGI